MLIVALLTVRPRRWLPSPHQSEVSPHSSSRMQTCLNTKRCVFSAKSLCLFCCSTPALLQSYRLVATSIGAVSILLLFVYVFFFVFFFAFFFFLNFAGVFKSQHLCLVDRTFAGSCICVYKSQYTHIQEPVIVLCASHLGIPENTVNT